MLIALGHLLHYQLWLCGAKTCTVMCDDVAGAREKLITPTVNKN